MGDEEVARIIKKEVTHCLLFLKSVFFSMKTAGRATTAVLTAANGASMGRGGADTIGA